MSRKSSLIIGLIGILLLLSTGGFVSAKTTGWTPTWVQVNAPDMVTPGQWITGLQEYKGQLFALAGNTFPDQQAIVWRSSDGSRWEKALEFGSPFWLHMGQAKGKLYLSGMDITTYYPAKIWRSSDGITWDLIMEDGFGDDANLTVSIFKQFEGWVYAGTYNDWSGAQVWRSRNGDPGTWEKVFDTNNYKAYQVTDLYDFQGRLYMSIEAWGDGEDDGWAQVWSTADGKQWEQVLPDGFGETNYSPGNFMAYKGYLYLGTAAWEGGQLLRSPDGQTWSKVFDPGYGDPNNFKLESLIVYLGDLYMVMDNFTVGATVWRSVDGLTWTQVNQDGFGNPLNHGTQWGTSNTVFHDDLYLGVYQPWWDFEDPTLVMSQIWKLDHP
ncbi:MAG TPA: hypothetical protein PJ988_01590 [Anaerolinea sp.]|nr:hypothetical protein [Anaerolinea sp.]